MMSYEYHLNKILKFIREHKGLIDCHLSDFFTDTLWNELVPSQLRLEFDMIASSNPDIDWWKTELSHKLNEFKNITNSLRLESCSVLEKWKPLSKMNTLNQQLNWNKSKNQSRFMKEKKLHEVEIFAEIIAYNTDINSKLIIDAGSGKAYLSEYLSRTHDIPVLAIESSLSRHNSALNRKELVERKRYKSPSKVHCIMVNINEATDFTDIINSHIHTWNINKNLVLIGLHACGNLTHSIVRAFISSNDMETLCVIPCCYHFMTKMLSGDHILSRNARMLAQQSIDKYVLKHEATNQTLFYRAILQILLKSMGMSDTRVGRAPSNIEFPDYALWALNKIGVSLEQLPSPDYLRKFYESYRNEKWKFEIFQLMRIHLSSILEAAIILDMAVYLEKDNNTSRVRLFQLFDSSVSPRNYCIIAKK